MRWVGVLDVHVPGGVGVGVRRRYGFGFGAWFRGWGLRALRSRPCAGFIGTRGTQREGTRNYTQHTGTTIAGAPGHGQVAARTRRARLGLYPFSQFFSFLNQISTYGSHHARLYLPFQCIRTRIYTRTRTTRIYSYIHANAYADVPYAPHTPRRRHNVSLAHQSRTAAPRRSSKLHALIILGT